MPWKFNPFTTQLDFYLAPSTGTGVMGPPSSTIGGIATWSDTNGTTLADNPYSIVQAGGAVQAQEFIFNRYIVNTIVVPDGYAMLGTDVELTTGDIVLEGDSTFLLL